MKRHVKPFACPSPSRRVTDLNASGPREGGYALLIVMMLATILLISLTAALPNLYTAGQREREEELLFRGNQYARAIILFHRQFRRYPASVKELLQTNGIRFLRHAYPDPMSRTGKWRFIHADANGVPLDSRTLKRAATPVPGQTQRSAAEARSTAQAAEAAPEVEKGSGETSTFFGQGRQIQGAFIIGVASSSRRESIRVWNGHTRYGDWEFLGVETAAGAGGVVPSPTPGQPSSPTGGPQGSTTPAGATTSLFKQ
jgi:type II secretory pathway pseudopilin PulG